MSLPLTPSYTGFIGSTKDAVLVIQAVLRGDFPLVDHRPQDRERAELIKSGNVFVFIEESSGIKRWTDGISWSASRILGRFLVYRELDPSTINEKDDKRKRRKHLELWPLRRLTVSDYMADPALLVDHRRALLDYRAFDPNVPDYVALTAMNTGMNPLQPPVSSSLPSAGVHAPNAPHAALNAYGRRLVSRDKPPQTEDHGLIKKTLSVTTASGNPALSKDNKQTIHLISYYSAHDVLLGKLTRPSHGSLKNLEVPALLWDAVKRSSLGGKIPIEDEAYYFLDSNYQLQNMSVLLTNRSDASKNPPLAPSHQPVAKPLQTNPSKLPYVLPVPFSGPAPPLAFHVDYAPPLFLLQTKPPGLGTMEHMKKEDEPAEMTSVSTYSAPTSLLTFSHSSNYSFPDQRSPEVLVLLFASSQPSQHPLYDQLLHLHHQQYSHHPQQVYSLPGPSGSLDHQYPAQESVYVPGYSSQYPGVSYQMYNSAAYFNPGGDQSMQPANTNPPPGENASSLKSQQVQHHPQQFLQVSPTDPQTRPQQQTQQHQLQSFDYYIGQRPGYFGNVTQLNPPGNVPNRSARKRPVEYPEYFAPTEEPYNYN